MKTVCRLISVLTVFISLVSCSLFQDPLVGTWRIDRIYEKESETLTFTDTAFSISTTKTDTGAVTTFAGTYTKSDSTITFQYTDRNGSSYSYLNVIQYTCDGDSLKLCWDYTEEYTRVK